MRLEQALKLTNRNGGYLGQFICVADRIFQIVVHGLKNADEFRVAHRKPLTHGHSLRTVTRSDMRVQEPFATSLASSCP